MELKQGDIVRHKKDDALVRGTVRFLSKTRKRAMVRWERKDNPRLIGVWAAYYPTESLEPIQAEGEKTDD